MRQPDWTDGHIREQLQEMCSLPPVGMWFERMNQNPNRRGWYWVRLENSTEQLMRYGTSKKRDCGRERLFGKMNKTRVVHWMPLPEPQTVEDSRDG